MSKARDANWIDGLRGIASLMVTIGHLTTSFAPYVHAPANSAEARPELWQLPIIRTLFVGGRTGVAFFFLITGYVNAIGPIGRARAGNTDAAFSGIARSSLARSGRLILPTTVATCVSWFLAQTNAYAMAKHVDATWIRQGWHGPDSGLFAALKSLVMASVETWTRGWNDYDGTQWTLVYFLFASMMVYTTMTTTVLITPKARKVTYVMLYLYCWVSGFRTTPWVGMNVCFGMLVAELHNQYGSAAPDCLPAPIPLVMILVGIFLAGFPQDAADRSYWSSAMEKMMLAVSPEAADIRRHWDSIGASMILLGIFFSQRARNVLSSPYFNFLGRVSFPVYLLHNTFIKSILVWMIYLPSALNPKFREDGSPEELARGTTMHIIIAIAVFYYILYRVALLWTVYVDPLCAKAVKWMTGWAYGDNTFSTGLLGFTEKANVTVNPA